MTGYQFTLNLVHALAWPAVVATFFICTATIAIKNKKKDEDD